MQLYALATSTRGVPRTEMREPVGLPADAPANIVVTLVSLDAGILVVTLSFHDTFADLVTCSGSAGNSDKKRASPQMYLRYMWLVWIVSDGHQLHV